MTTTEPASRWRHLRSVRVRVVLGYVTLLATALAITTLVIRQILLSRLHDEIDRELVQEVDELRQLVEGINPRTGQPFGPDVQAIFDTFLARNVPSDGEAFYTVVESTPYLISAGGPPELLEVEGVIASWTTLDSPELSTVRTGVGDARTLVVPLVREGSTLGVFAVAVYPREDVAEVLQAVRIVALVGAVVLVVTSVLAWSIAGRVVRPVRELTTTARLIGERDLSARIPVQGDDELAELGRTFNEMLDRLESAFSTQRRVLDDVAHELRTPITIVQGHLEMMELDPESQQETIALVLDELDRMTRYVGDLLLVAKAEQPDFLRETSVDLGELGRGVLARVAALADREWVLDQVPAPAVASVIADEHRLTQALVGLATNAVQHTAAGDCIGLGIEVGGTEVRMWVRDTGPGIDPTEREHLFDRFTRGAGSRDRRPDGTGLGLAIVAAIARAHGGGIEADNEPGRGARFTLAIPRRPAPPSTLPARLLAAGWSTQ